MQNLLQISIVLIFIMLASISGVFFLQKTMHSWLEKNLSILISFSAGVFLIIAVHLGVESFEILQDNILVSFLSILAGIAFFLLIKLFWPESHHHNKDCKKHSHTKPRAFRMMLGDAIHNVADGFIIVPAFIIDQRLGIATAIGVFIHEILQEISEFFVLKDAGYSTREALIKNFLVSTTIVLGAILGMLFQSNHLALGALIGFASGSFIYLVAIDLFPYKKIQNGFKTAIKHINFFLIGLLAMLIITSLLGH